MPAGLSSFNFWPCFLFATLAATENPSKSMHSLASFNPEESCFGIRGFKLCIAFTLATSNVGNWSSSFTLLVPECFSRDIAGMHDCVLASRSLPQ